MHNNIILFKNYQLLLTTYKINKLNKYYLKNTTIRFKQNIKIKRKKNKKYKRMLFRYRRKYKIKLKRIKLKKKFKKFKIKYFKKIKIRTNNINNKKYNEYERIRFKKRNYSLFNNNNRYKYKKKIGKHYNYRKKIQRNYKKKIKKNHKKKKIIFLKIKKMKYINLLINKYISLPEMNNIKNNINNKKISVKYNKKKLIKKYIIHKLNNIKEKKYYIINTEKNSTQINKLLKYFDNNHNISIIFLLEILLINMFKRIYKLSTKYLDYVKYILSKNKYKKYKNKNKKQIIYFLYNRERKIYRKIRKFIIASERYKYRFVKKFLIKKIKNLKLRTLKNKRIQKKLKLYIKKKKNIIYIKKNKIKYKLYLNKIFYKLKNRLNKKNIKKKKPISFNKYFKNSNFKLDISKYKYKNSSLKYKFSKRKKKVYNKYKYRFNSYKKNKYNAYRYRKNKYRFNTYRKSKYKKKKYIYKKTKYKKYMDLKKKKYKKMKNNHKFNNTKMQTINEYYKNYKNLINIKKHIYYSKNIKKTYIKYNLLFIYKKIINTNKILNNIFNLIYIINNDIHINVEIDYSKYIYRKWILNLKYIFLELNNNKIYKKNNFLNNYINTIKKKKINLNKLKKKLINKYIKSMNNIYCVLKDDIIHDTQNNIHYSVYYNYDLIKNQLIYINRNIINVLINKKKKPKNISYIKHKYYLPKTYLDLEKTNKFIKKRCKYKGYQYKKSKINKKKKNFKRINIGYINCYYLSKINNNIQFLKYFVNIYLNHNIFKIVEHILNIKLSESNNNMRYTIFNKNRILHSKSIGSIRLDRIDKRKWRKKLGEYLAYWVRKIIRKYKYSNIYIINNTKRRIIRLTYKKLKYYIRGRQYRMNKFIRDKKLKKLNIKDMIHGDQTRLVETLIGNKTSIDKIINLRKYKNSPKKLSKYHLYKKDIKYLEWLILTYMRKYLKLKKLKKIKKQMKKRKKLKIIKLKIKKLKKIKLKIIKLKKIK